MTNLLLAIVVTAALDSAMIVIGDQTGLQLQATMDATEHVAFPTYGDLFMPGVEIVDRTAADTTHLSDGRVQVSQKLTLTSFADSLFYIAPQPFVSGEDTFWTEALVLNVMQPFEIDTTLAITDIKTIHKAPIWWWGTLRWVLLGLLVIGLGVALYYIIRYIQRHRQGAPAEEKIVPLRPAEEVALERLDEIKAEKIWQEGKVKEYHTELTDVIREYISRRYAVSSTEKTSDETLNALKPLMKEQKELFDRLRKMLTLSDLVKFAKWTATPDENEGALRTAYDFVHETTPTASNENATEGTATPEAGSENNPKLTD